MPLNCEDVTYDSRYSREPKGTSQMSSSMAHAEVLLDLAVSLALGPGRMHRVTQ
ncbi:hypothetical protein SAMN05421595_0942 [Austwickia chelonae]|uniref:Uncharacterized protein n=1 Tax=Austwickia chelonae NBRC 105200 TaxID=1184607 RepID=K6ULC4_9MICO|nr:hypothetical protein AUCHE_05_00300 [Austwickia chelonae NBRC 105200]SEW03346.1 hypothetical protein SAMN05421595_0942 [Austwickia chelonae]